MRFIDHKGFLIDFPDQVACVRFGESESSFSAVASCQKEQLFDQMIHVIRFILNGTDAFFESLLI